MTTDDMNEYRKQRGIYNPLQINGDSDKSESIGSVINDNHFYLIQPGLTTALGWLYPITINNQNKKRDGGIII